MTIRVSPLERVSASAQVERWNLDGNSFGMGAGVVNLGDLNVTAGAGFGSVVAAGHARIRADFAGANLGLYDLLLQTAESVTHTTPDVTNPRIDQILARMRDFTAIGSGPSDASVYIQAGTPTAGATLDNRNGITAPSPGSILLADVLVPNGAASSAGFTYRDRRPVAAFGVIPPLPFNADQVIPTSPIASQFFNLLMSNNNSQHSLLVYIPRRIVATKIKWTYQQPGITPTTGNYAFAIYDASGWKMCDTGAVAITGAASAPITRAETIPSTVFEPGLYYLAFGCASIANSSMTTNAYPTGDTHGTSPPYGLGIAGWKTTGGTTLPQVLDHTDAAASIVTINGYVPAVTLATA